MFGQTGASQEGFGVVGPCWVLFNILSNQRPTDYASIEQKVQMINICVCYSFEMYTAVSSILRTTIGGHYTKYILTENTSTKRIKRI
jgi:hypothetical protein